MKAVVLTGVEAPRLHPLTWDRPKAMLPLFGKRLLDHTLSWLKGNGITEVYLAAQQDPGSFQKYSAQLSAPEWKVTCFKGGDLAELARLADCTGDEPLLLVDGPVLCDFWLDGVAEFHRSHGGQATMVLYRHPAPLDYDLVLTGQDGRVRQIIQRPGWSQVVSSTVATGIFLLEPKALALAAEEECVPGLDLILRLLQAQAGVYACVPKGYWADIRDGISYLNCVEDCLNGRCHLDMGLPERKRGVWSEAPLPEGVQLIPPCWIGGGVSIGAGSLIGPHTVLESGSIVGSRCLIQRAYLQGARVEEGATLYGTILAPNAHVRRQGVLNDGTMMGEGAKLGEGAAVMEGIKIWPGREVPPGTRLLRSLTEGREKISLRFLQEGVAQGVIGEDLEPERLVLLGSILGSEGTIGLGYCGGQGAAMLARAAGSGVTAAGGQVLAHELRFPAGGAWLARQYELPVSLFVAQDRERAEVYLFGADGLPLSGERTRQLEEILLRGERTHVPAGRVGGWEHLTCATGQYLEQAAQSVNTRLTPIRPFPVSIPQDSPADRALAEVLRRMGCKVLRDEQTGIPAFYASQGGFALGAREEKGVPLSPERLLTLVCMLELEEGDGRVAVPPSAPAAIEVAAAGFGGQVLRLGRDGEEARSLYAAQPWLRDACFAAARLCARLGVTGETLSSLDGKAPRFATARRDVPVTGSGGQVIEALAAEERDCRPAGDGVRLRTGTGWVYIAPGKRRPALRVIAECSDLELAEELCGFYAQKLGRLDRNLMSAK